MPVFLVIILLVVSGWKNTCFNPFSFECPSSQHSIQQIVSMYSCSDRLFDFHYAPVSSVSGAVSCSWSGYVNHFYDLVLYTCPNQGYLNGIKCSKSRRNLFGWLPYLSDRLYSFKCCVPRSVKGLCLRNCHWTSFVNHFGAYFNYNVPNGYVIRGVSSIFSGDKQDRRFKFEICKAAKP